MLKNLGFGHYKARSISARPWLLLILLTLVLGNAGSACAQLTGIKNIPGDYASIGAAATALNTQGVGANGVTFNVAAGAAFTERVTFNSIPTATSSNPIIFQKSGTGANPKITATVTGTTTTNDAIIALNGTDYVTFDGIDLLDPQTAGQTQGLAMEVGYGLYRATVTDGAQNNTIQNCTVTLNRSGIVSGANGTVYGIYAAPNTSVSTPAITTIAITGANSNNKFYANVLLNTQIGVYLVGYADSAPSYSYYDQNNDVGGTSLTTGNTIQNFGGYAGQANGVKLTNQNGANVSYNVIANAANSGVISPNTLYGVNQNQGSNSNLTISSNIFTLTQGTASAVSAIFLTGTGTGALVVNGNSFTFSFPVASTSNMRGIDLSAASFASETINNNTMAGTSSTPMVLNTTGTLYFINASNATPDVTVQGNTANQLTKTGAAGAFFGYYNTGSPTGGTALVTGNTISNIVLVSTGTSTFEGIDQRTTNAQHVVVNNNIVSNITAGARAAHGLFVGFGDATSTFNNNTISGIAGASTVNGLIITDTSTATASQNEINNISSSATSGEAIGLFIDSGTTNTANANKIYNISGTATNTKGAIYGLYVAAGTTINLTNNMVGNITASALNITNSLGGIFIFGGTTVNAYNNTIYLNASSTGTNFGTMGLFVVTTTTLDLRNNIVVNTSTPAGSGQTVAYRRSSTTLTTYASTSNNNLFYAGTPSATQLIYYDGTAGYQTLAAYKSLVGTTRDAASVTENPSFLSTTGAVATFLHISPGIGTQAESGGTHISGVITDIDGDTRDASTPDIGADEFSLPAVDIKPMALVTPTTSQSCYGPAETITVSVKNQGTNTLNFAMNPATVTMNVTGATTATLTGTLNSGTLAPNATQVVTLASMLDMSTIGAYTFVVSATVTGDQNTANDVLMPNPVITTAAPVAGTLSPASVTICQSGTASLVLAGAANGTIQYQSSPDGTTFTDVLGATSATYTTPVLTSTAFYRAQTRCGVNNATSNVATITVNNPSSTTYTGAATGDGNNWFNAANWTACVPGSTVDAVIPTGLTNYPNLSTTATAEVRSLTLNNGASLTQSAGTLNVYGNLTSSTPTANVALTGGSVAFVGPTPTVAGLSSLYNLTVSLNSAAGTLTLANNVTVTHVLTLTQGILTTGPYAVALAPTAMVDETDASYVLGQVTVSGRTLSTATAETFGNIGLTLTPDAASAAFPGLTTVVRNTGMALTGSGSSASVKRWFRVMPTVDANLTMTLKMDLIEHERNGIINGNLLLFSSPVPAGSGSPATATWVPYAASVLATPSNAAYATAVEISGLTHLSDWTLGNRANPLPVELAAFTADRQGTNAALVWTTASEKSSRGFEVQVSPNGRAFRVLDFVASSTPTSTNSRSYVYLDLEAGKTGLRYYRLRQVDLNGTATFSSVRTVRFDGEPTWHLMAAPNPFRERLMLSVELPVGVAVALAQLSLTDAAGRTLLKQLTPALPAGLSQIELSNLAKLASGVYFVHLAVPGQPTQHLKVVKE